MLIQIKSSTEKDSWYSDAIGQTFNVWEMPGSPFYWADFQLIIFKGDAVIVKESNVEKGIKAKKAVN